MGPDLNEIVKEIYMKDDMRVVSEIEVENMGDSWNMLVGFMRIVGIIAVLMTAVRMM